MTKTSTWVLFKGGPSSGYRQVSTPPPHIVRVPRCEVDMVTDDRGGTMPCARDDEYLQEYDVVLDAVVYVWVGPAQGRTT